MKNRLLSFLFAFVLLASPLLLAACAENNEGVTTQMMPPSTPEETIPVIWDPQNEIWKPGFWALGSGGFYWVAGYVMPRPNPTAVWNGDHWARHTYGWTFEKGHWE